MAVNRQFSDILAQAVVANTLSVHHGQYLVNVGTQKCCALGLSTAAPGYEMKTYIDPDHASEIHPEDYYITREFLISHEVDPTAGLTTLETVALGMTKKYPSYHRTLLGEVVNISSSARLRVNNLMIPNTDVSRLQAGATLTDIPYGTVTNFLSPIFCPICDETDETAFEYGDGSKGWPPISHFGLYNTEKAGLTQEHVHTVATSTTEREVFTDADNELIWWGALDKVIEVKIDQAPAFKVKNFTIQITTTDNPEPNSAE